jgi:hypothetical protein
MVGFVCKNLGFALILISCKGYGLLLSVPLFLSFPDLFTTRATSTDGGCLLYYHSIILEGGLCGCCTACPARRNSKSLSNMHCAWFMLEARVWLPRSARKHTLTTLTRIAYRPFNLVGTHSFTLNMQCGDSGHLLHACPHRANRAYPPRAPRSLPQRNSLAVLSEERGPALRLMLASLNYRKVLMKDTASQCAVLEALGAFIRV